METLFYYSVLIIWISYAYLEGFRESFLWHARMLIEPTEGEKADKHKKENRELHQIFTIQRAMVWLLICSVLSFKFDIQLIELFKNREWWEFAKWIGLFLTLPAMFPFVHDGSYYIYRNAIWPGTYKDGFFDQSNTSTAATTKIFKPILRVVLFGIAVVYFLLLRP